MQKVLGVSISSDGLRLVLLANTSSAGVTMIGQRRIGPPGDARDPADLRAFQVALSANLGELRPDVIAIRKNQDKGTRAAGHESAKMEAVLLLLADVPVLFVTPQAIRKVNDKLTGPRVWNDAHGAALHVIGAS